MSDSAETALRSAEPLTQGTEPSAVDRFVAGRWVPLAVAGLAGLISAVNLGHVSMWFDEAATRSAATRSFADLARLVANLDAVHATYYVIMHPWLSVAGDSAIALRLPSVLAVAAAAAGVVVLTRQLAGPQVALAAGLIFAVLPRVTGTGTEGRSFALTMAVAVWLTVLFVDLLRRPSPARYAGYAVLAGFGVCLNIFLVLLLGAHGLALLLDRRLRFRRQFWSWLGAATLAAAIGLPVILAAISQSGQIGATRFDLFGYLRAVLVNQWFLADTPTVYFSGTGLVVDGPGQQLWKPAAVLLAMVCWLLIAYAVLDRRRDDEKAAPLDLRALMITWAAFPTIVLVAYALIASPIYNPRYLTFATPAIAILTGWGLVRLGRRGGRWSAGVALLIIVGLAAPVYASQRTEFAKNGADWQAIAEFVAARRSESQAVYYAPRTPDRSSPTDPTARTAQVLYPAAFGGITDLTLVNTAAAEGNLHGRSRPLADSVDRLDGIRTVFVINRVDYPPALVAADEAVLTGAGFVPGERWSGPLNTVVVYTR